MESKITIDIDKSGLPQLKIVYQASEDLRDRLVGRFLAKMGIPGERRGFWCYCRLGHETQKVKDGYWDGAIAVIEPMDKQALSMHYAGIQDELDISRPVDQAPVYSNPTFDLSNIPAAFLPAIEKLIGMGHTTPRQTTVPTLGESLNEELKAK